MRPLAEDGWFVEIRATQVWSCLHNLSAEGTERRLPLQRVPSTPIGRPVRAGVAHKFGRTHTGWAATSLSATRRWVTSSCIRTDSTVGMCRHLRLLAPLVVLLLCAHHASVQPLRSPTLHSPRRPKPLPPSPSPPPRPPPRLPTYPPKPPSAAPPRHPAPPPDYLDVWILAGELSRMAHACGACQRVHGWPQVTLCYHMRWLCDT